MKSFNLGKSKTEQRFRSLFTRNVFTDYLEIDPNNNEENLSINKEKSLDNGADNKTIGINANNGNINNVNAIYLSGVLTERPSSTVNINDANINTINFTGNTENDKADPFDTIYAQNETFYFVSKRPNGLKPSTNVIDTDSVKNNICIAKLGEDYLTLRSGIKTYGDVFIGTDDHRKTTTINGNFNLYSNTDNDGTTKNFLTIDTGINARVDDTITFRGTTTTLSTNEGDDKNIRNWIELSQNDDASINENGTKINNNFHIGYRRNNNTNDGEYKFRVLARTGDTEIKGKLNVSDNTTIGGTLSVSGNININNKFTITASNGNTSIGGTLSVSGAITNTDLTNRLNAKADKASHTNNTNTFTKITYNSQGIIIAGTNLVENDIPPHYHTTSQIIGGGIINNVSTTNTLNESLTGSSVPSLSMLSFVRSFGGFDNFINNVGISFLKEAFELIDISLSINGSAIILNKEWKIR